MRRPTSDFPDRRRRCARALAVSVRVDPSPAVSTFAPLSPDRPARPESSRNAATREARAQVPNVGATTLPLEPHLDTELPVFPKCRSDQTPSPPPRAEFDCTSSGGRSRRAFPHPHATQGWNLNTSKRRSIPTSERNEGGEAQACCAELRSRGSSFTTEYGMPLRQSKMPIRSPTRRWVHPAPYHEGDWGHRRPPVSVALNADTPATSGVLRVRHY